MRRVDRTATGTLVDIGAILGDGRPITVQLYTRAKRCRETVEPLPVRYVSGKKTVRCGLHGSEWRTQATNALVKRGGFKIREYRGIIMDVDASGPFHGCVGFVEPRMVEIAIVLDIRVKIDRIPAP